MKQESPTHPPSPYSYLVLAIDAERNKRGKETSDVFLLFPLCLVQVVRWLVGKRNLAPLGPDKKVWNSTKVQFYK